jgi:AraC family transcriptional regulator of arabinose operon
MPTRPSDPEARYLVTGLFDERPGYRVVRSDGCHDWLLIATLAGCGEISHARGRFTVLRRDVVLIAPGATHCYEVAPGSPRWRLLWAHFSPPALWRPWMDWTAVGPGVARVTFDSPALRRQALAAFAEAHRLSGRIHARREQLALNAVERTLLWCSEQDSLRRGAAIDARLQSVVDEASRRLDEPLSVAALARWSRLSPSRLAHLFRESLGVSPMQYVERLRIERAKQLLEHSDLPVAAVARRVGFADPFHFSRRFKKSAGSSPSEYRERLFAVAGRRKSRRK